MLDVTNEQAEDGGEGPLGYRVNCWSIFTDAKREHDDQRDRYSSCRHKKRSDNCQYSTDTSTRFNDRPSVVFKALEVEDLNRLLCL